MSGEISNKSNTQDFQKETKDAILRMFDRYGDENGIITIEDFIDTVLIDSRLMRGINIRNAVLSGKEFGDDCGADCGEDEYAVDEYDEKNKTKSGDTKCHYKCNQCDGIGIHSCTECFRGYKLMKDDDGGKYCVEDIGDYDDVF